MEDRKRRILQAIIDDYIHTAEPVGSRTVARKCGLGVSPATIRNEMADLEDMGYLEQPHTSAGRVPSDKGYRFYVDTLTGDAEVALVDPKAVLRALTASAQRIEGVLRQATHLMAEMTDVLAMASQPSAPQERLVALQIVPIRGQVAVLLLVADDGRVFTRMVEFAVSPDPDELDSLGRALSRRLFGLPLQEVSGRLEDAVSDILGPYRDLIGEVGALLGGPPDDQGRLVVEGTANLLKQPEFRQSAKANRVLAALEGDELQEDRLASPLGAAGSLEVYIGREIRVAGMAECSLVTAAYAGPGGVAGRIGVLGPRRMPYARMMAVVGAVAAAVTVALHGQVGGRGAGGGDVAG